MIISYFIAVVVSLATFGEVNGFTTVTGRGPGIGCGIVLSEASASSLAQLPVAGIAQGRWQVEFGGIRRFEMSELEEGYLAAAYGWRSITMAVAYSQFGEQDMYIEKTIVLSMGYLKGPFAVGVTSSMLAVSFGNGYEGLQTSTVGLSLAYRRSNIHAAIMTDNLTSPCLNDNSPARKPAFNIYTELLGRGSFSVLGRMTIQENQKPQLAVGQKLDLSSCASLLWGVTSEPLTYGGGFEIGIYKGQVRWVVSCHPTLGFTHAVSVSFGTGRGIGWGIDK